MGDTTVRTLVILNPSAGGGDASEEIVRRSCGRMAGTEIRPADSAQHTRELAAGAAEEGFGRVVAAGGDGTLNAVINGLAPGFEPQVGLLPLGTGNDFARTLGIPEDPAEAVNLLLGHRTRPIDVVRFDEEGKPSRWFLNASAGGFSGEVNERLNGEIKELWGPMSYFRTAVDALSELESYRVEIEVEDGSGATERLTEPEVVNVVVANGRSLAAGIRVAPDAEVDDGLVELVVIRAAPVSRLSVLGSKVLVGRHLDDELIIYRRARRIGVRSEPTMPFNVDGELTGHTPVRYEVEPGAVRFVAPLHPPE